MLHAIEADATETDSLSRVAVMYKVGTSQIIPDSLLESVVDEVNAMMAMPNSAPERVIISGSSSPEGPAALNDRLARARATSLRSYLLQNSLIPDSLISMEYYPEDWESVIEYLNRGHYSYADQVKAALAANTDRYSRKVAVKRLSNGRIWRSLLRDVFPLSRNSRLEIVARPLRTPGELSLLSTDALAPRLMVRRPQLSLSATAEAEPYEDRFLALKNNLLFDAVLVANLGVEVELWRHWSLDVPVWYSPYDITSTRKLRLLATQPELRYWPGKAGEHHFVGVNASVVGFNIAINDHGRYQDPEHAAWGAGISYGYACHLDRNRRWGLEFNIGVGFLHYHYDAFYNCPNGALFRTGKSTYYGVTRAGISISYQWHRQRKNRGVLQW